MTADLLVGALLTIVVSGGVLWLGMRHIARLPFSVFHAGLAAVIPLVLLIPLELTAGFFFPDHVIVVYLATTVIAIALQALILRVLCRRTNETLSRFKACLIATLAMLGCLFIDPPIYVSILDRFFPPG
jgi:hypothetical protein